MRLAPTSAHEGWFNGVVKAYTPNNDQVIVRPQGHYADVPYDLGKVKPYAKTLAERATHYPTEAEANATNLDTAPSGD